MKIKKNSDKSPEDIREIAFWRFLQKKSMDKKLKKNFSTVNNLISYTHRNHEETSSKTSDSDNDSLNDNSSTKKCKEKDDTEELKVIRQLGILAFESEEEEITDEEDAFTSFTELNSESNLAHLSVFINFTIVHSISEPILFYLITNLYTNGSVKDMKVWAYEIYSSFLAPFAPLKILDVTKHETVLKDIEMKLAQISTYNPVDSISSSYSFEMLRHLRDIFNKPRMEVQKIIVKQLEEFQSKRKAGLETMYGASPTDLKAAKENQETQQTVIEKNLMPKLLQMLEDLEENNGNSGKMILVSALSTVSQKTFHISYFEPINQFVSPMETNTDIKTELSMKGHQLVPKICYSPTNCDFCLNVLWGIAPQGYECECGIKIHESCIEKLTGMCILHKDENESDPDLNESKDIENLAKFVQKALGNRYIENYKRSKGERPKSDPGVYSVSSSAQLSDSSDGSDLDESVWSTTDTPSTFKKLSDDERKRKDVITELFETERRHVKTLKVLQNVFFEPLKRTKALSKDLANSLFPPSFFIIKDWHMSFETMLKKEWEEQHGNLLEIGNCLTIFEEPYGNILKENAASFCAGQKKALEQLRLSRVKNEVLQRGLIKAESHKRCKRLQLKDLMLSILQRITKYPLLFERILKFSHDDEREKIQAAYEASKNILTYVNNIIRNYEELEQIQLKLDKTYSLKEGQLEYRNFNLSDHKLIFDGYAMMKKCPILLRVLLFEKYIVFLHKQDDKYFLRSCDSMKLPIVKLYTTIIRSNAIDNKSFFLISQATNNSQMLELNLFTEAECKLWMEKISATIEKAKKRMALKRKPSAESAQSMLRQDNKINLPISKQSELATITQALFTQANHIEEWIESAQKCLQVDSKNSSEGQESDTISACMNTFNCLISQLTMKIAERDHERECLLKENQRLREHKKS